MPGFADVASCSLPDSLPCFTCFGHFDISAPLVMQFLWGAVWQVHVPWGGADGTSLPLADRAAVFPAADVTPAVGAKSLCRP